MSRIYALLLLTVLAGLCATPRLAAEETATAARPLMLGQTIDFLDNCFFSCAPGEEYYTPEQLRRHVQQAYDAGFRRIYFRAAGGVTYYPSKLRRLYNGSHRADWAARLHKTVRAYDTVREYLNVCHELGMELYYWEPIYDAGDVIHNYPGTKAYDEWGYTSNNDVNIKDEHCVTHRFYNRPAERPTKPIGRIELYTNNEPVYEEGAFDIYVADHGDKRFTRYAAPFQVEVAQGGPEGARSTVTISGLNIDKPVIKLFGKKGNGWVVGTHTGERCAARAFYTDGTPVDILTCCEVTDFAQYGADANLAELRLIGFANLYGRAWGNNGESFIIRIGDFKRRVSGMPDYAFMENRERLRNIVTELYERYPDLDCVTFSIRTHHQPPGGVRKEVHPQGIVYGYAEPIVSEFKRRYGVDVLTQDFDVDKFQALRGEYFTQALEGVSKIVHAHGGKLECMAPVRGAGSIAHGSMYPWWGAYNLDNFFDIRTWAQKGIVDNVIMLGTKHRQDTWGPEWHEAVQRFAERLAGTQTRLSLHLLVNHSTNDRLLKLMVPLLREEKLDEVEAYEEFHMALDNVYPTYIQAVKDSGRKIAK